MSHLNPGVGGKVVEVGGWMLGGGEEGTGKVEGKRQIKKQKKCGYDHLF